MTSETSIDIREVVFINERCRRDYYELPDEVGESADEAIDAIQNGRRLLPKQFSKLKGSLAGVEEIRVPYNDDTYRVYITLECEWIVMIIGAGIKKSPSGSEIPQEVIECLEARLKKAREYSKREEALLKGRYAKRKKLLSDLEKRGKK